MLFQAMSVGYTVNELVNTFNLFLQEYPTKHASQVIVVLKHNLSYNLCVNFTVPTEMGRKKKTISLVIESVASRCNLQKWSYYCLTFCFTG